MSLLNGCRNLARVGKSLSSSLPLSTVAPKNVLVARVSSKVGIQNSSIGFTQRSFVSGSRSMNKFLTQGDQKLAEFLSREINLEKEDYNYNYNNVLPRVKGFQSEITGSEVSLTKDYDGEKIVVKFNINNTVEDEAPEMEEDTRYLLTCTPQDKHLKSRPKFQIDLTRRGQTLTFLCCFTEQEDAFEIEEFYIHAGSGDESPTQYIASADIIEDSCVLYNLFMNMLYDRGISRNFANEIVQLSTAHEHKLYTKTLEDIKQFLHS